MRSKSIRSIRRAELSRAAFEAVVQFGLRRTTLDKVGAIAGVSKGCGVAPLQIKKRTAGSGVS